MVLNTRCTVDGGQLSHGSCKLLPLAGCLGVFDDMMRTVVMNRAEAWPGSHHLIMWGVTQNVWSCYVGFWWLMEGWGFIGAFHRVQWLAAVLHWLLYFLERLTFTSHAIRKCLILCS